MRNNRCNKCEYSGCPTYDYPCSSCAGFDDKPKFQYKRKPIDQAKDRLFKSLDDIQKIIDDAMEKGDRSVHISVVGDGVSLNVYPYKEDDGMGVWIPMNSGYYCSKCNSAEEWCKSYCSECGAKMKFPEPEGEKDDI